MNKNNLVGKMVKVLWIDAFSYSDEKEQYVINTTRGEWVGTYTVLVLGRKFKYADILQETTESTVAKPAGHARDGVRIPYQWILSVEEVK